MHCSALQCIAVCCCFAVVTISSQLCVATDGGRCSALQCVAVHCSALQCVVVLQLLQLAFSFALQLIVGVAVCCSVFQSRFYPLQGFTLSQTSPDSSTVFPRFAWRPRFCADQEQSLSDSRARQGCHAPRSTLAPGNSYFLGPGWIWGDMHLGEGESVWGA